MNPFRTWKPRFGLLIMLAIALSKVTLAQLVLYDNFNSTTIDPGKWTGFQFYSPDQREAVREVVLLSGTSYVPHPNRSGRLHLAERDEATTTDDFGGNGRRLPSRSTTPKQ